MDPTATRTGASPDSTTPLHSSDGSGEDLGYRCCTGAQIGRAVINYGPDAAPACLPLCVPAVPCWAAGLVAGGLVLKDLTSDAIGWWYGNRELRRVVSALGNQVHRLTEGTVRLEAAQARGRSLARRYEVALGDGTRTWSQILGAQNTAIERLDGEVRDLSPVLGRFEDVSSRLKDNLAAAAAIGTVIESDGNLADALSAVADRVDSAAGSLSSDADEVTDAVGRLGGFVDDFSDANDMVTQIVGQLKTIAGKVEELNSSLEQTTARLGRKLSEIKRLKSESTAGSERVERELRVLREQLERYREESEAAVRLTADLKASMTLIIQLVGEDHLRELAGGDADQLFTELERLDVLSV